MNLVKPKARLPLSAGRTLIASALAGAGVGVWLLWHWKMKTGSLDGSIGLCLAMVGILSVLSPRKYVTVGLGAFVMGFGFKGFLGGSLGAPAAWPASAVLLVAGMALLGIPYARRWSSLGCGIAGAFAAATSLSALFGHLAYFPGAHTWGSGRLLSEALAWGLFALGIAYLAAARLLEGKASSGGWRWVPMATLVGMATVPIILWQGLVARERTLLKEFTLEKSGEVSERIESRIDAQVLPLRRMANRWRDRGRPEVKAWEAEAKLFMRHFPAYRTVAWFDGSFVKRWSSLAEDAFEDEEIDFGMDSIRRLALTRHADQATPLFTRGKDLRLPGSFFQIHVPVFHQDRFDGYLVALIQIPELMDAVLQDNPAMGFVVRLNHGEDRLYERGEGNPARGFSLESTLDLYGISAGLVVAPTVTTTRQFRSLLPEAVLGSGLFLALLVAFLARLSQVVNDRARELETANRYLAASDEQSRRQSLELMEAREAALEASRHKSEFLANMSHEIRTPLNAVVGMAELILDTKLNRQQLDFAKGIQSASTTLLALISDILDFSKIEADKLDLESADFDLSRLLESTQEMFVYLAAQKNLKLKVELDSETPPYVRGDSNRLRQILVNLVGNAIKFTREGEVAIYLSGRPQTSGKVRIDVEVADTGIGLTDAQREPIFESFSQADTSTSRRFGGSGLGLSICRRLVTLMGGEINVESQFGKGSSFAFFVLLDAASTLVKPETKKRASAKRPLLKVLVAEDNPMNQKVVRLILEKLQCEVDIAVGGAEAIQAAAKKTYDIIFLDCQMPGVDGYEAVRRIREAEAGKQGTPVVALTAHAMASDREKCLAAGMDDYLSKPISLEEMGRTLEKWSSGRKVAEAPTRVATAAPEAAESETLDRSALFSLRLLQDGSEDFVTDLIRTFKETTPKSLDRLAEAIVEKDGTVISDEAHRLKSGCASLGAKGMAAICLKLERVGEKRAFEKARALLKQLRAEYRKTLKELEVEEKPGAGISHAA